MIITITYQDQTRRIIEPVSALINPKKLVKGDIPFEKKVIDLAETTGDPLSISVVESDKVIFVKNYKPKY